jgi:MFS family permease
MTDDLNMSSNDYSLALVIFFISYIVFEVPSNLILAKTRPSLYIPGLMFAWGICVTGMAFVQSYSALLALRFLVGLFEAGFAPGVMLMLSCWYKKSEQSRRFSVFYSAAVLSGAFGGLVAGGISSTLEGARGLRGWRWLFVGDPSHKKNTQ